MPACSQRLLNYLVLYSIYSQLIAVNMEARCVHYFIYLRFILQYTFTIMTNTIYVLYLQHPHYKQNQDM
jgi:hypothetical protein